MRCGRILVEGEAEETIPVPPKAAKPRQKRRSHGKKRNPYSSVGLDKFASLNAELSAKREYIARKTGTPEAMVRFAYTHRGWVPVVVKSGIDGGVPIPIRAKQDNHSKEDFSGIHKEKEEDNPKQGDDGVNGSASREETLPVMMPWWSGYLKTTAFGALTVSAIMVRKSAVPAAAMAVVMVVGTLQKRWLGGVLCMKRFIGAGISYFSELFLHWKRNPEIKSSSLQGSLQVQLPVGSPEHKKITGKRMPLRCLSAPCSPTVQATGFSAPKTSTRSQELNTQLLGKKDNNKQHMFRRILSMDDKPIRLRKAESFARKRKPGRVAIDSTVGATAMIILLFFLVFYGRLSAIFFTSAW
ncbi:hypothetical protein KI387_008239, partial [Taxus chinensis]